MPSDKALYMYPEYGTYFLAKGNNKVTTGNTSISGSFFEDYPHQGFSNLSHRRLQYMLPLELML